MAIFHSYVSHYQRVPRFGMDVSGFRHPTDVSNRIGIRGAETSSGQAVVEQLVRNLRHRIMVATCGPESYGDMNWSRSIIHDMFIHIYIYTYTYM